MLIFISAACFDDLFYLFCVTLKINKIWMIFTRYFPCNVLEKNQLWPSNSWCCRSISRAVTATVKSYCVVYRLRQSNKLSRKLNSIFMLQIKPNRIDYVWYLGDEPERQSETVAVRRWRGRTFGSAAQDVHQPAADGPAGRAKDEADSG